MTVNGENNLLGIGDNADVVTNVISCYEKWREQPKEIVTNISGQTTDQKCEAVFAYLVQHVDYLLDKPGYQFIKSPARLLEDGCGDCKSFSVFIASCLHCLEIPHIIRFVNFDGCNQFSHVYVVAIDEAGNEIKLDACEKDLDGIILYNFARPFARKKDFRYGR